MVKVYEAQQTLDNREAGIGHRIADGGEHRRPAASDQSVGNR